MAVVGLGMANSLALNLTDAPLTIYLPKRDKVSTFEKPFTQANVQPAGVFLVQQEMENQIVLADLNFVQELLRYDHSTVSAIELKLFAGFDIQNTYDNLRETLGPTFLVENRYEQEAGFLKLMLIEKWLSFAIVGLMMLLISFNLIGALWMVVLEKEKDIAILKSMGATGRLVRRIFLYQGILLCGLGIVAGFLLAILVYAAQKNMGIIALPGGSFIDAYPVSVRWWDFLIVALTVCFVGLVASILPARRAGRVPAMLREE